MVQKSHVKFVQSQYETYEEASVTVAVNCFFFVGRILNQIHL